jgi:sarcosine oxidase subunit gamma
MAELRRAGALDALAPPADTNTKAALRALPPGAQFIFRGPPDAMKLAGTSFGVSLPQTACRAIATGGRAALWLGPDEFLLLAEADEECAIEAAIAAALGPVPHALVSVSHRNTALEVSGTHAARLLNAGCPLDLDEQAFPTTMCSRTVLAKAPIVLWRTAPHSFYVGAWRSFAPYVWEFLVEARSRL